MRKVPSLIFLIGFMGAGKTTVGRVLAERLDYAFVDLDEKIEADQGRSVREIFSDFGEAEFRRHEREAIQSCGVLRNAVVALGGGAYVSEQNRALIRSIGEVVWLDCPIELCLSRIGEDSMRPLRGSRSEMEWLFAERRPSYEQAGFVVDGTCSPEQVASSIVELLRGGKEDENRDR